MTDWRNIFGFKAAEDITFGEVHERYRTLMLSYTSPIQAEDLRRLNLALDAARLELGTARVKS